MSEASWNGVTRGLGAAPGRASGKAYVMDGVQCGLPTVLTGSILVARILHPHLAPLFFHIAGIVVEEGALLQHATTLAREIGVPAVVGIRNAVEVFRTGEMLNVNGDTGEVMRLETLG